MSTAEFISPDYPLQHPGVQRAQAVARATRQAYARLDAARVLAALLLSALVASLVVVGDQVVSEWADGHLLVAWVALWVLAFTALVLVAPATRRVAARVVTVLDAWSARRAQARADARMWRHAQRDPRLMAELQAALSRADVNVPRTRAWS